MNLIRLAKTQTECKQLAAPKSVRAVFVLTIAVLVSQCVGCAQWHKINEGKWPWADDEKPSVATRMVPMWTDTILYEPNLPGIRGFAARIYFYEDEGNDPVKVDGSLVIYAFDGETYETQMPMPEKKFVFTAEQLAKHHSTTKVGHSYSIWLPWGEVGGPSRQITLITKFKDVKGSVLVSEPSRKLLPGIGTVADQVAVDGQVEPAGYTEGQDANGTNSGVIDQTISIDLPPSFVRRLNAAEEQDGRNAEAARAAAADRQYESRPSANSAGGAVPNWNDSSSTRLSSPQGNASVTVGEVGQVAKLPHQKRLEDHFVRRSLPVQNASTIRPTGGLPRREPYPGGWLTGLPPTPRYSPQTTLESGQ